MRTRTQRCEHVRRERIHTSDRVEIRHVRRRKFSRAIHFRVAGLIHLAEVHENRVGILFTQQRHGPVADHRVEFRPVGRVLRRVGTQRDFCIEELRASRARRVCDEIVDLDPRHEGRAGCRRLRVLDTSHEVRVLRDAVLLEFVAAHAVPVAPHAGENRAPARPALRGLLGRAPHFSSREDAPVRAALRGELAKRGRLAGAHRSTQRVGAATVNSDEQHAPAGEVIFLSRPARVGGGDGDENRGEKNGKSAHGETGAHS